MSDMAYSGVMSNSVSADGWRKSSRSNDPTIAACIEVKGRAGVVLVRDSKVIDEDGLNESDVLSFDTATFGRFISAVKAL